MKSIRSIALLIFLFSASGLLAQRPIFRSPGQMGPRQLPGVPQTTQTAGQKGQQPGQQRTDTTLSNVERRDYSDDSVQVSVYSFALPKASTFDTSIRDFSLRWPVPPTHVYLGNDGSATHSLLFAPPQRTGFDPGFHSHDVYKWRLENIRFYNTPRPYTELGYLLGTRQEQVIDILHTQNIRPFWNASFQYRMLSAPGYFRNQKNNQTNFVFTSWYQSPGKRYNNYLVLMNNKIQASENGGIRADDDYLEDPVYRRSRLTIPTNLGGDPRSSPNPFSSALTTGRREKEFTFLLRQQYDFGRKDSLVTDSTVIPLFYPRLRFEHSFRYGRNTYFYQDQPSSSPVVNVPDTLYYKTRYGLTIKANDTLFIQDSWKEINNDFSIYQFPDAKNLQQYIRVGLEVQLLTGQTQKASPSLYNIIAHGEYRNRTRNQKWDITAFGRLHTAGYNSGDYHAYVSLQRLLSKELGTLQVGFENINRSPSFIYDQRSSFYLDAAKTFSKENTAHAFAGYFLPGLNLQLNGDYYFVTNYLYLDGYRSLQQERGVFNLLRVSGLKTFRLNRRWNVYSEVYVQQKAGAAQVNVPLFFTRNRLAYEGRFFRNLNLSTGLEVRYHSPYKADDYSPVLGQFVYQDTLTISNRPDVHAFLHMRIRSFRAYLRVENLNTIGNDGGFGFHHHNLAAPYYPLPGMFIRFGIYWSFIN